jgi:hypothetical protein
LAKLKNFKVKGPEKIKETIGKFGRKHEKPNNQTKLERKK